MEVLLNLLRVLRSKLFFGIEFLGFFLKFLTLAPFTCLINSLCRPYSNELAGKKAVVVCPSPDLNSYDFVPAVRDDYAVAFLNSACRSPLYLELRPEFLFLMDGAFLTDVSSEKGSQWKLPGIKATLERIITDTNWPLTLIVPLHFLHASGVQELTKNPNIQVKGLPHMPLDGPECQFRDILLGAGLVTPRFMNVLSASIYFFLRSGCEKVYLWGAHHTWTRDNFVDFNNQLMCTVRHSEYQLHNKPLLRPNGDSLRFATHLRQLSIVFQQYHELHRMAGLNRQLVINATADSFIDAFPRVETIPLFKSIREA